MKKLENLNVEKFYLKTEKKQPETCTINSVTRLQLWLKNLLKYWEVSR